MSPLRSRSSPFSPLGALVIFALAAWGISEMRSRPAAAEAAEGCDPYLGDCLADEGVFRDPGIPSNATRVEGADVCTDGGYLCADWDANGRIHVRRWLDDTGTIVVHVPAPDFEESAHARALQRAAAAGVRAWNNRPFPILVDERGRREAHFSVTWTRTLGGQKLGQAQTRWSPADGLGVRALQLVTRNPFDTEWALDPAQIRLTAAHEMGHALGLGHSDAERDVMYPTNTAPSLSAQDHKTLNALYDLPDGAVIVR